VRRVHARRIEACIDLVSRALKGEIENREEAVKELERLYRALKIEPIRGWAKINLFDKEMCTVYVVAKYGLGLDVNEYKDLYERILGIELKAERAAERIKAGEGASAIAEELGFVDENTVFRIARLEATAVLLGFKPEDGLVLLLDRLSELFPGLNHKIASFKKFYIAFKIAQGIAEGTVRTRLEKEALKHALCIKFKAEKAAPSDDFIRELAINVLKLQERYVANAVSLKTPEEEIEEQV
jgi:hypothetical protein